MFDFVYRRRILGEGTTATEETIEDYAQSSVSAAFGDDAPLTDAFVTAETLSPAEHVAMQGALQPYVDSAISKTIICPEGISFEDFRGIYAEAFELGLKGCTTYRPNPVTGAVLSKSFVPAETEEAPIFDEQIARRSGKVGRRRLHDEAARTRLRT